MYFQFIPALIRLFIVFAFVVICIRKNISLGNTFFLGSIVLGILFGLAPGPMLRSMTSSIIYPKTLFLAIIVYLILVLSNSMEIAGQMQELLNRFKGLITNPRLNIILFPALIGLLPMPGGAVFSAPMVKQLGMRSQYSPAHLSFINYWFRHIWEYWWPMYPGVLLITVLADINLTTFILFMCPITIIALSAGYRFLKGSKRFIKNSSTEKKPAAVWPFLREMSPILIVIIPGLSMGIFLSYIFPDLSIAKESGLVLALSMAIGWVWYDNELSASSIGKMLANPQMLKMIYMIISILIFKGILEDSNAVEGITHELTLLNVPLVLIIGILPFLVGTVTGITLAFVGSTFPILISLINSFDPSGNTLPYVMLAMVCGFSGVLISPVHLCLILSNEYFGTTMGAVYRHLWLPCAYTVFAGFTYFYIISSIIK